MPKQALFRKSVIWCIVLLMYLFLFIGIGWIAFWDQDFNNPEITYGRIITALERCKTNEKDKSEGFCGLLPEEYGQLLKALIEDADNSAGDLQELASQSFNIVLGAILAFLSASATMVFQTKEADRNTGGQENGSRERENETGNEGDVVINNQSGQEGDVAGNQATNASSLWDYD